MHFAYIWTIKTISFEGFCPLFFLFYFSPKKFCELAYTWDTKGKRGDKVNFRSMFKSIFKTESPQIDHTTSLRYLNAGQQVFNRETYYSADILIKTCIDVVAKHCAKLSACHVMAKGTERVPVDESNLNVMLNLSPNQYVNAYSFYYKIASQVFATGNAFVNIRRDSRGMACELSVLDYQSVEARELEGNVFLQFVFADGNKRTVPYQEIVHVRNKFLDGEFISARRDDLNLHMELLATLQTSFADAANNSGKIKGVAQIAGQAGTKAWQEKAQLLATNLNNPANGGIVVTDGTINFTPVTSTQTSSSTDELDYVRGNIYRYFGLSEEIVKNIYNEEQWTAFFESTIEPYAIQLSQEFSRKLFSRLELNRGNRIYFDANRLNYASTATKTEMIRQLRPLGILTTNQCLEMMNLPPIEEGNNRVQTLNVANTELVDNYQLSKGGVIANGDKEGIS